jgi:hypothetical protein
MQGITFWNSLSLKLHACVIPSEAAFQAERGISLKIASWVIHLALD